MSNLFRHIGILVYNNDMDTQTIQELGLNESQANMYVLLMQHGSLTPPEAAKLAGETRTTVYSIFDKLEKLGLVKKKSGTKKVTYLPENPAALEKLAESKYQQSAELKQKISDNMTRYMTYFYTYQEQPGVRFFQGKDGIIKMYEDQLRTKQDIYFLRSESDVNVMGKTIYKVIENRHKLGIKVYGIESKEADNVEFSINNDKRLGREMSFYPTGQYTAPVNIYAYGSKTALISYGEEVIGTIIESPQIAQAFRQIHSMLKDSIKSLEKPPKKGKL